jgi:Domain of unknown function (DUF4922)
MIKAIEELFHRQVRQWPQLAAGIDGVARARTRQIRINWFEIFVRHIPHRISSTTAQVDQHNIAKRPCFLCKENLPREEEGIQFGRDFTIYCNPFPIVDRHLTIAHNEHRPQRIADHLERMLELAEALPGYFIIYNGPECGASAPDHMHFQAGSRRLFPIEKETSGMNGIKVPGYGRNVLLLRGTDRFFLADRINYAIGSIAEATGKREEPMVNIAVFYESGEWVTYLFPRGKHRPEAFHTGELTVSPGSIDLCGIFVAPLERDFERITGDMIVSVLREVTLPDRYFQQVVTKLENEL